MKPIVIVALGSSAGGLAPLKKFFSKVETDSQTAYVVITHLDPRHSSLMPELLSNITDLDVKQVENDMKIEPGTLFIIAPDTQLTVEDGSFKTQKRQSNKGAHTPINAFFKSLAGDFGKNAIGIILSGTGTDGSGGIIEIKQQFGLVLAQDPQTAEYSGMPDQAIKTGLVDKVLPPEDMPGFIREYIANRSKSDKDKTQDFTTEKIQRICELLRNATGHDFSGYKENTIKRRIVRRMDLHKLENIDQYIQHLEQNNQELDVLLNELLIGVTNFFRDPPAWDVIKMEVLPQLSQKKNDGDLLRVWVVGTATGQEAYSMALTISKFLEDNDLNLKTSIFATDIDKTAIENARKGEFPESIKEDVPKDLLDKYFTKTGSKYVIDRKIRDMLVFAEQNMLKDPPFSKMDLICCRNVLIYMKADLQKKLMPMFHYSLNEGGILFLGSSESVGEFDHLFKQINSKWKIFKRMEVDGAYNTFEFPLSHPTPAVKERPDKMPKIDIEHLAAQELMTTFVPPSVVIDQNHQVLYIHGRIGRFLEPAAGKVGWDVIRMAREGLTNALPAAIHQAVNQNKTITRNNIEIQTNGDSVTIDLTVRPLHKSQSGKKLLLISFHERPPETARQEADISAIHDKSYQMLEQELADARENLQSTVEELETSNEELRSMNEEYQSTNEELKSANEELETSREELQSLNEELTTVNYELQDKIESLNQSQKELQMFLDSLEIPTVFLDEDLNIVRFTAQAAQIFHIIESDIGRPIHHFSSNLKYDSFLFDVKEVTRNLQQKQKEVSTIDGHWYLLRILPYRTSDNRIRGAAVNLVDIDQLKLVMNQLERSNAAFETTARIIDEPIVVLDKQFEIILASDSFYREYAINRNSTGQNLFSVGDGTFNHDKFVQYLKQVSQGGKPYPLEIEKDQTKTGKKLVIKGEKIESEKFYSLVLRIEPEKKKEGS